MIHLTFFALHIVGFSLANTAIPSLLSRYSDEASQGANLGFNAAMASASRVFSPLVSGLLYEEVSWVSPFVLAAGGAGIAGLAVQALLAFNKSTGKPDEIENEIEDAASVSDAVQAIVGVVKSQAEVSKLAEADLGTAASGHSSSSSRSCC